MRFRFIDTIKAKIPVDRLCALLGVSVSRYHAWRHRRPSKRQLDDMLILAHIRAQFSASNESYGSPRMHAELCEDGVRAGRHRIARLMRDNGLKARRRRFRKTTASDRMKKDLALRLLRAFCRGGAARAPARRACRRTCWRASTRRAGVATVACRSFRAVPARAPSPRCCRAQRRRRPPAAARPRTSRTMCTRCCATTRPPSRTSSASSAAAQTTAVATAPSIRRACAPPLLLCVHSPTACMQACTLAVAPTTRVFCRRGAWTLRRTRGTLQTRGAHLRQTLSADLPSGPSRLQRAWSAAGRGGRAPLGWPAEGWLRHSTRS